MCGREGKGKSEERRERGGRREEEGEGGREEGRREREGGGREREGDPPIDKQNCVIPLASFPRLLKSPFLSPSSYQASTGAGDKEREAILDGKRLKITTESICMYLSVYYLHNVFIHPSACICLYILQRTIKFGPNCVTCT